LINRKSYEKFTKKNLWDIVEYLDKKIKKDYNSKVLKFFAWKMGL